MPYVKRCRIIWHSASRHSSVNDQIGKPASGQIMEKTFTPSLVEKLLDDVESSFAENEHITDSILMSLHAIFSKVLESAVDLIESDNVTVLQLKNCFTKADQFLIQVASSSGTTYTLFHRINYCQCIFYQQKVLHSKLYPACKHFIAANLAYIWNKYRKFEIDFNMYKECIENTIPKIVDNT